VPVKPSWLPSWILELPDCPARRVIDLGLADRVKNGCEGRLLAWIQSNLLLVSQDARTAILTRLVLPRVVSGTVYDPTSDPSKYP
jgi:hypothetical protein